MERTCEKCQTKTTTPFCPTCGNKLEPAKVKSVEQIEHQMELMDQAMKLKKDGGPLDFVLGLMVDLALKWVLGESSMTPVEIVVHGKGKDSEEIKALIELSKMYN